MAKFSDIKKHVVGAGDPGDHGAAIVVYYTDGGQA